MDKAIQTSRLGEKDKSEALKNLSRISQEMEKGYTPRPFFDEWVQKERDESWQHGAKPYLAMPLNQSPKDRNN